MIIVGVIVFVSGIIFFGNGNINTAFINITENLAGQDGNLVKIFNPASNYYAFSAVLGLFIIQFAFASQPQLFNKVLSPTDIDQRKVKIGDHHEQVRHALLRLTSPTNYSGNPGLSVPCGFSKAGLPIGFQLIGKHREEAGLYQFGYAYEQQSK